VKPLSVNEIRERYLAFFEGKEHLRLPSFPLVPHNDNSLLLINSGMAPLKPYFTGQEIPPNCRIATCQKCVRTVDIDEVGRDARHVSFFQMLGNFSFGDYFKAEVIPWAWEFLTTVMEIPVERLYVSVYKEDEEAYEHWRKIGLGPDRIFRLGKEDNFWEHGVGPCGPCSEIFFDRGKEYACDNPYCAVGCDCDRYMEVWNLVFTQFNKLTDGGYEDLVNTNIDTGMGLERLAIVMQGAASIFDIDTFLQLRDKVRSLDKSSTSGGKQKDNIEMSVNIIADHVRSIVFMAADGVLPSNEGRGYIVRRLLRRAVRHAKLLGQNTPFIAELCPLIIEENANAYPELAEKQAHIIQALSNEEERFFATLDTGMTLLEEQCTALRKSGKTIMSGEEVFRLYDTYGFPPELTEEMLTEKGFTYDIKGFQTEMDNQRKRARAARGDSTYMGTDETVFHQLDAGLSTEFVGYDELKANAKILAMAVGETYPDELSNTAKTGDKVAIFLDRTPFYTESGGQKSDSGCLILSDGRINIVECLKVGAGKVAHIGIVTEGSVSVGELVIAEVNPKSRQSTTRNHTATHLLNKALRKVLGDHIEQAGSEVSPERLRFDFTHFASVNSAELQAIEDEVNACIFANLPVSVEEMSMDEARKAGAIMLMGEKGDKYGSSVRVVNIGAGTSIELCGGTHLKYTAQIGLFKLIGENSVAAGVRRIEAVTGPTALAYYRNYETQLLEAASILKSSPDQMVSRVQTLSTDLKQAKQELERLKSKLAVGKVSELLDKKEEYEGLTWLSAALTGLDAAGLRTMGDQLKEKVDVLLLAASTDNGPVQFVAHASKKAVESGVHAGNMVKEAAALCGGNGGGRPNSAQAGGKDASMTEEALVAGIALAKNQIGN